MRIAWLPLTVLVTCNCAAQSATGGTTATAVDDGGSSSNGGGSSGGGGSGGGSVTSDGSSTTGDGGAGGSSGSGGTGGGAQPTMSAPATPITFGGKSYSKNACPSGDKLLTGSWRLVDGKTEDPDTPLNGATTAEKLIFKGSGFIDKISGNDRGSNVTQVSEGWYFCADATELPSKHYGVHIEKANPNGAFGNEAGSGWFGEFLMKNPNQMAVLVSDSSDKNPAPGYLFYCRIGSTVNGHDCTDPLP